MLSYNAAWLTKIQLGRGHHMAPQISKHVKPSYAHTLFMYLPGKDYKPHHPSGFIV